MEDDVEQGTFKRRNATASGDLGSWGLRRSRGLSKRHLLCEGLIAFLGSSDICCIVSSRRKGRGSSIDLIIPRALTSSRSFHSCRIFLLLRRPIIILLDIGFDIYIVLLERYRSDSNVHQLL